MPFGVSLGKRVGWAGQRGVSDYLDDAVEGVEGRGHEVRVGHVLAPDTVNVEFVFVRSRDKEA